MNNRNLYEQICNCEACYKNSFREHRSKKEENEFHLCEHCTEALEEIRGCSYTPLEELVKETA